MLGVVDLNARVEMTFLRPETAPAVIMPDCVVLLDAGEPHALVFHGEFLLNYFNGAPSVMARYGGSLAWQYNLRVLSTLILLRPQGVPAVVPEVGEYIIGDTRTIHPFRVVRMWELDPAPVLAADDPRLFPWALLMKSTDEEVRRIGERLSREGDPESISRFLTLGSVRYDRKALEEMLGGPRMGLVEAILEGSSLVKEATTKAAEEGWAAGVAAGKAEGVATGMAEGKAEGLAEGISVGRENEARRLLRIALQAKFPGLEEMSEIGLISSVAAIEAILVRHALNESSRAAAQQAILAAAANIA